MKPDPWQEANDELEMAWQMIEPLPEYFDTIQSHVQTYVTTIETLIANYKPFSVGQKSSPASLGFYAGSPEVADERFSIQEKRCAECSTKTNIWVRKNPKTGNPMIMCNGCWEKERK